MDTKDAGRMGGKAKVPKGFSTMSEEERAAHGRKGAEARWSKERKKKAGGKKGKT
jgi:hypothetical protein